MKRTLHRNIEPFRIQWLLLAIVFLVLAGTIAYFLTQSRRQLQSIDETRLTNLATVVDTNLRRQLEVADLALQGTREDLSFWGAHADGLTHLNRNLRKMTDAMPGLRTLLILDAQGIVLASNREELVGKNFAEREYFKVARQHQDPAMLHLSPPFKTALGVFAMNLSRMVPGPKGEFGGIVAATLDPEYFTLLLDSVLYAPDMRATLIHGDGSVFLLVPDRKGLAGTNAATPGSFFTRHRESGQLANLFPSILSLSGEKRMMAVRTITPGTTPMDKPLIISLSRDLSATFSAWRKNALVLGGLLGLFALASAFGLAYYHRRQREYSRLAANQLAELQRSKTLLDATGHIAKIGAWALTLDTQEVTWSTEIYHLHELDPGLPPPEKEKALDFYPPEARPVLVAALEECAKTGRSVDLDLPFITALGKHLWVNVQATAEQENGRIVRLIGACQDITERKQEEEAQQELKFQLVQAQKMEAIGTLAGGIAHDFNNILSIIFGYVELAILEKDPENRQQHLKEVIKAASRAKDLVAQILTFSRKKEQQKQPLQVSLIIKEALKMLRASIPTTIEIRQDIASNGMVLADPTQIHQIIINLCTNAYHAMRETGGTLAVSLEEVAIGEEEYGYAELAPGSYLKLEVSDTGCGIDPKIQEKIFEPYFTTKKQGEGTGMGLAVVHGIVKSHHGHITVYSEPGKGTSVHVYLPLTEQKASVLPVKTTPTELMGHGERVAFVDDEEQLRDFVAALLSKSGYRVITFANGVHALEEFQRQPEQFDLVITDMTMPYMTGAELAQKILGIKPLTPIILCTGQSELINREKALAMGICDYLNKPFLTDALLVAAKKALEKEK